MLNEPLEGDRTALQSPRRRGPEPVVAALVGLILVGAGAFFYWRRAHPVAVSSAPAAAPAKAPLSAAEQEERRAADSLKASGAAADESVRARLERVSPRAEWSSWLAQTRDLIESGAVIVANFSDDEDARRRLQPLVPSAPFEVIEAGGVARQSARSAQRFDTAAGVIESIDASALASAWRALHPLIAAAYRPIAQPGVSLDKAAANALARIENAPLPRGEPALEKAGSLWIYSDPALEKQGWIEKLLMRTGPQNEASLQAKARAIRGALALHL